MIDNKYIQEKIAEYKSKGVLTFMRCSVTGKETFCKTAFPSRLKKFKDIEDCLRHWVSREGQKILQGSSLKKPNKNTNVQFIQRRKSSHRKENHFAKSVMSDGTLDYFWRRPGFDLSSSKRTVIDLTIPSDTTRELTQNMCWRPDIYLDNNKFCNNCPMWSACHYYNKRLLKSSPTRLSSKKTKTKKKYKLL